MAPSTHEKHGSISQETPSKVFIDDQSAIDVACNKGKTNHKKYIGIRHHHLSHYVKKRVS